MDLQTWPDQGNMQHVVIRAGVLTANFWKWSVLEEV